MKADNYKRKNSTKNSLLNVNYGFFLLLTITAVILLSLVITLTIITVSDNKALDQGDKGDPGIQTPGDSGAASVGSDNTPLFPTTPSRDSYVIGQASDVKTVSDIKSENTILVDLESFTSIAEKNADKKIYPASMTKVMTLLVACENITNLNTMLTIKQEHLDYCIQNVDASSFFGKEPDLVGEQISVKDALYLISYRSDTISCLLIAEHIATNEEAFVELMNKKAKELDLTNTNFTNCTGLYNANHYSTCREIASIMAYAIENQMAKEILFSTDTYTFQSYKFYTTKDPNKKVTYYPSPEWYIKDVRFNKKVQLESSVVVAGKTGYIDESGVSLVSVAKSDSGKYYINVIVGQPKGSGVTESISTNEVKKIYNTYIK